jgi:nucleotide-binding universal stress UspA family protein
MKYSSKRILLGIEDSESSTRVVEYVADLASGNGGFVIYAFHAVGPVPLELREFRGAEDPKTEEKLDSLLYRKREEWIETAKSQARSLLNSVTLQLSALGIPENTITTHVIVLDHKEDLIGEILKTASRNQCGTIIVGQSSFPWFKELFASHTGEELLKQSEGFAICVVQ